MENENEEKLSPLEAAIDKATGFDPEKVELEKKEPEKRRDYAREAYECFIKNAEESDVSDPFAAIEKHFRANATDELKAKCKAKGKTAAKAFAFLAAVARECPRKNGGVHIPPVIGFAICMHYFQDVPVDWDAHEKPKRESKTEERKPYEKPKFEKAKPAKKPTKKPVEKPPRKNKQKQEFFFDLLETPVVGPSAEGKEATDAE